MPNNMDVIIYIIVIMLVPLVPALILYKFLPSNTIVNGPFKGLTIDLSGAFGGYFLLVLIASGFIAMFKGDNNPYFDVWKVTGNVAYLTNNTDHNNLSERMVEGVGIRIVPPIYHVETKGSFSADVIVFSDAEGKPMSAPSLAIGKKGYIEQQINLLGPNVEVIKNKKEFKLKEDIRLPRESHERTTPKSIR